MPALTHQLKQEIRANARKKSKYHHQLAEVHVQRAEWLENVRLEVCGGVEKIEELVQAEKEIVQDMERIPHKFRPLCQVPPKAPVLLNYSDSITLIKRNNPPYEKVYRYSWDGSHNSSEYSRKTTKIVPRLPVVLTPSQVAEHDCLADKEKNILRETTEINIRLNKYLDKFQTTEDLVTQWPEAEKLLPKGLKEDPKPNSASVQKLNEILGLK